MQFRNVPQYLGKLVTGGGTMIRYNYVCKALMDCGAKWICESVKEHLSVKACNK